MGLGKDAPEPRGIMRQGEIIAIPQVGGLHHRYERRVALELKGKGREDRIVRSIGGEIAS